MSVGRGVVRGSRDPSREFNLKPRVRVDNDSSESRTQPTPCCMSVPGAHWPRSESRAHWPKSESRAHWPKSESRAHWPKSESRASHVPTGPSPSHVPTGPPWQGPTGSESFPLAQPGHGPSHVPTGPSPSQVPTASASSANPIPIKTYYIR